MIGDLDRITRSPIRRALLLVGHLHVVDFCPAAFVPVAVVVLVLPSADTTVVKVCTCLPPFLRVPVIVLPFLVIATMS